MSNLVYNMIKSIEEDFAALPNKEMSYKAICKQSSNPKKEVQKSYFEVEWLDKNQVLQNRNADFLSVVYKYVSANGCMEVLVLKSY